MYTNWWVLDYLRCAPNGPHILVLTRRINHIPVRTISILIIEYCEVSLNLNLTPQLNLLSLPTTLLCCSTTSQYPVLIILPRKPRFKGLGIASRRPSSKCLSTSPQIRSNSQTCLLCVWKRACSLFSPSAFFPLPLSGEIHFFYAKYHVLLK